ncbi:MAG: mechanosensitive ion channel family protein [Nocardiopsaceae bacterium]|nr:mechanosensitive ion channel family protein [Nocardiopsaceae bacterium]
MTRAISLDTWITAAASVGSALVIALAVRGVIRALQRKAARTRSRVDDLALTLVRIVLPSYIVIGGVWAAVLSLPLSSGWRTDANHGLLGLLVIIITVGAARVAGQLVQNRAMSHSGTSGSATIFVNITRVIVLAIGLLLLLNTLGVQITPLLTALGVGGLAVALALQDTLENLFAGVHILASHQIEPGAYILLDNGMEGYVQDTNWRNTIIRQTSNNFVVVPNDTLAKSILTNYHQPDQTMSVSVEVGVGYDSDLDHVERVTGEVGREVMREVEAGVPEYEPLIRFTTFGDSSITCKTILRASEATVRPLVVHEFIKRLHRRYRAEGIDIPYPIMTVARSEGMDERELDLTAGERGLD